MGLNGDKVNFSYASLNNRFTFANVDYSDAIDASAINGLHGIIVIPGFADLQNALVKTINLRSSTAAVSRKGTCKPVHVAKE